MHYALWVAVALAAAVPVAHAQTVPVDGTDYQIGYSGAGVEVSGAVLDATGSLDIDVSADDDATLRITVPSEIFGSSDPSRVDVLVDFGTAQFEAERDGSDIVISVMLDVASFAVQILYDDLGAGTPEPAPPATPPDPEPATPPDPEPATPPDPEPATPPDPEPATPPDPEPATPPDPEPATPPDPEPATPAPATPEPAPPATPPDPEPADPAQPTTPTATPAPPAAGSVVCGEGTYELDGVCVASCGPGLVLSGEVCVPAASPPAANTARDLVYGTAAGFAVAFAAVIILWMMARASRSQQP